MSALEQQLQAHRQAAPVAPTGGLSKQKASLLFDPREAADLDIATVKDIGCNGLAELVSLDARFSRFEESLFNIPLSSTTERHMMTPDSVAVLNKAIEQFLQLASPFLPFKPTQKALEFLIRRYHIETYNVDALMMAALPYHETELFTKVLALPVKLENSRWEAFTVAQRSKKTVSRTTLAKYAISEPSIIQIALKHVKKCCSLHPKKSSAGSQVPSFVAALLVDVLKQANSNWVKAKLLPFVVPHVISAAKQVEKPQLQVYSYVVVLSLAKSHQFNKEVSRAIATAIIRGISNGNTSREADMRHVAVKCLASFCEFQKGGDLVSSTLVPGFPLLAKSVTRAIVQTFGTSEALVREFTQCLTSFNGSILASGLLLSLIHDHVSLLSSGTDSLLFQESQDLIEPDKFVLLVSPTIHSNKVVCKSVTALILRELRDLEDVPNSDVLNSLLQTIARAYPEVLDASVDSAISQDSTEEFRQRVGKTLELALGSEPQFSRHLMVDEQVVDGDSDVTTNVFMAVRSGSASTRSRALDQLAKQIWGKSVDKACSCDSLMTGNLEFVPKLVLQLCGETQAQVSLAGFKFLSQILENWTISPVDDEVLGMKKIEFLAHASQVIINQCSDIDTTALSSPREMEIDDIVEDEFRTQVEEYAIRCCRMFPIEQLAMDELSEVLDFELLVRSLLTFLLMCTRAHITNEVKSEAQKKLEKLAVDAIIHLATEYPDSFVLVDTSSVPKKGIKTVLELVDSCVAPNVSTNFQLWTPLLRLGPEYYDGVVVLECCSSSAKESVLEFQAEVFRTMLGRSGNSVVPTFNIASELCSTSARLQSLGNTYTLENMKVVMDTIGNQSASEQSNTLTHVVLVLLSSADTSASMDSFCSILSGVCGALVPFALIAIISERAIISFSGNCATPPKVLWQALRLVELYLSSTYKAHESHRQVCIMLLPTLVAVLNHPSAQLRELALRIINSSLVNRIEEIGFNDFVKSCELPIVPFSAGSQALVKFELGKASEFKLLLDTIAEKNIDIHRDATCITRILGEEQINNVASSLIHFIQLKVESDLNTCKNSSQDVFKVSSGSGCSLDICHTRGALKLLDSMCARSINSASSQCAKVLNLLSKVQEVSNATIMVYLKRLARTVFNALNSSNAKLGDEIVGAVLECLAGDWDEVGNDCLGPLGKFLRSLSLSLLSKPHVLPQLNQKRQDQIFGTMLNLAHHKTDDHASARCLQLFRNMQLGDLALRRMVELASESKSKLSQFGDQLANPNVDDKEWLSHVMMLGEVLSLNNAWGAMSVELAIQHLDGLLSLVGLICEKCGQQDASNDNDSAKVSYSMTLLLGIARQCCAYINSSEDGQSKTTKLTKLAENVKVEVVVASIVKAVDPHSRTVGLKLLSQVAVLCPHRMLHEISPILVRVCDADLSHWDDRETYNVLDHLVKSIVPLARSELENSKIHSSSKKHQSSSQTVELTQILIHFDSALYAASNTTLNHKLDLYSILVDSLSPESGVLWAVVALLLSRGRGTSEAQNGPEMNMFCHALLNRCSALEQIGALKSLISNLDRYWSIATTKHDKKSKHTTATSDQDGLMNPDVIASTCMEYASLSSGTKEKSGITITKQLAGFVANHLSSRTFAAHLVAMSSAEEDGEDDAGMQDFLGLLQSTIREMHRCSQKSAEYGRKASQETDKASSQVLDRERKANAVLAAQWSTLRIGLEEVLDRVSALLSVPMFVAVVKELVDDPSPSVRQIALRQLGLKVKEQHTQWDESEIGMFVEQTVTLREVLESPEESVVNKQTAVVTVDVISKYLAPYSPDYFVPVAKVVVGLMNELATGSDDSVAGLSQVHTELFSSLCLCAATLVKVLGNQMLALFPVYCPLILEACEQLLIEDDEENADLKNLLAESGATAMLCVVQELPKFMSPYLLRLLKHMGRVQSVASEIHQSILDQTQVCLVEGIDHRTLLPTLCRTIRELLKDGELSASQYVLSILRDCIESIPTNEMSSRISDLTDFFIDSLSMRKYALIPTDEESEWAEAFEDVESAEASLQETFMALVMQLRERQLRPMFTALCDSVYSNNSQSSDLSRDPLDLSSSNKAAKISGGDAPSVDENNEDDDEVNVKWTKQCKASTLFVLCQGLLDNLQGIFIPMFEGLVSNMMEELDSDYYVVAHTSAKKRKRVSLSNNSEHRTFFLWNKQQMLLRTRVVGCLTLFFKNCGVLGRSLFDQVVEPLVKQLDVYKVTPSGRDVAKATTPTGEEELEWYDTYTSEQVVPCITEFAAACGRESSENVLWQTLHHKVLRLMRHKLVQVRLAALQAVSSCFEELGDEYIILLADTLPYVSELLEDEDPDVRRNSQQLAKLLQDISGEDIQTYLR